MREHKKSTSVSSSNKSFVKKSFGKKDKLTGLQKAAVFLISMGPEASSEILKHLKENEIQELVREIASIKKVDSELKESILKEFQSITQEIHNTSMGGKDTAKEMLEKTFGSEKAGEMMNRIETTSKKPLQSLNNVDPEKISQVLKNEHPQTIAIVLAYLEPKQSAEVLKHIPSDAKAGIVRRIASLRNSNKDLLNTIESSLIEKLEELPDKSEKAGGINAIVNILNSGLNEKTRKQILDDLEDTDTELADEIKRRLITFDDIIYLLDKDVQLILSKIDIDIIAKALKLSNDEVKEKILRNVSKRVYQEDIEPILSSGPMKAREIEQAQNEIVQVMRSLINSGEIYFSSEYVL